MSMNKNEVKDGGALTSMVSWVFGFLVSYFIFSTVLYFLFFRQELYVVSMLVVAVILSIGSMFKWWLR